jgi:predicted nucleic acid-binding protein
VILIDSDVLIAHLRGDPDARDWMLQARRETGPLATSAVNVVEVAGGMRSQERREVGRLFASLQIFSVNDRSAWRAAELMRAYRRSHAGIGLGDYLVAAVAQTEGCELATLNVRHFPMFPGLQPPFTS